MLAKPPLPGSFASVLINTYVIRDDVEVKVGEGTGFYTKIHDKVLVCTNWHVLTNRQHNNPSLTVGPSDSPTHFRIYSAEKTNYKHFIPSQLQSLYDENGPVWFEHPKGFEWADLALIRLSVPDFVLSVCVQDVSGSDEVWPEPGYDVCIVGFPFGLDKSNPFPIWKKAMVASEPNFLSNGLPYALLDTAGRPGMSGSPVYLMRDGFRAIGLNSQVYQDRQSGKIGPLEFIDKFNFEHLENPNNLTKNLSFIGVYSGSLGDNNLDRLNLGRFWSKYIFDEMLKSPKSGFNPFPPS